MDFGNSTADSCYITFGDFKGCSRLSIASDHCGPEDYIEYNFVNILPGYHTSYRLIVGRSCYTSTIIVEVASRPGSAYHNLEH